MSHYDASDASWTPINATTWQHVAYYRERAVRDWRWLWLRKRRFSEPLYHLNLSTRPAEEDER